jgi:predicted ArsR family transcriptional regulator
MSVILVWALRGHWSEMKPAINPVRHEILTLLKRRGPLCADELAMALGMSGVAVRQHLDALETDGLVSATVERRRKGRPRHLFALTEAADDCFPNNYHVLAAGLMEQVVEQDGIGKLESLLEGHCNRVLEQQLPSFAGKELKGRLEALARLQDERGHMAELEEREDGSFCLQQFHCPLCRVARQFPQICERELELFGRLLEADVTHEQHRLHGDRICSFLIRPKRSS